MKPRRKMLLCVTVTSMAAAVGCTPAQPVGIVGRPDYNEREAAAEDADAVEASAPVTTEATPVPDAGWVGKVAVDRDAGHPPNFHPDRVGTTGLVDDSPSVGTTARVPDKNKTK